MTAPTRPQLPRAARTLGTLALLQAALPVNLAVTAAALVASALAPRPPMRADRPRTILLSGGKMTKALTLARALHRAGHRVVLVESSKYRFTGHRFSRSVDRFHVVPRPQDPRYAEALLAVVRSERVDIWIPVCSPASSRYDAMAKVVLEPHCEVLHSDLATIDMLDDKFAFARRAADLGLPVPDTHRITDPEQVAAFDFGTSAGPYVLKSIPYDPVHRLDLTPLPRPQATETAVFAHAKPISAGQPWILQAYLDGREYCTHGTVRDGHLQVYVCCRSSAFQVNYEPVDHPGIEAWVRAFVEPLKLTGQISFDFIETPDGQVRPIECNPRTHSAITLFAGHPGLAEAYLEQGGPTRTPLPERRPTYWLYHELWRALRHPSTAVDRARVVARGRDAIFDWRDPLPFLLVHHLQIPALLLGDLVNGRDWLRIDFNIGKLVEPAGD